MAAIPFLPVMADGEIFISNAAPVTISERSALQYDFITAVAPSVSVPGVGELLPENIAPRKVPNGVESRLSFHSISLPKVETPAGALQKIIHHNGKDGVMEAQWVFLDVTLNGKDKLDKIFSFPIIADKNSNAEIEKIIKTIRNTDDYFEKMSAAYALIWIITKNCKIKTSADKVKTNIEKYANEHYFENIKATDLAKAAYCSVSQVFRYTKKYFGVSPANYVNTVRLQHAHTLLMTSKTPIGEIGLSVGFSDTTYFNKLFKKSYGYSPTEYKKIFG